MRLQGPRADYTERRSLREPLHDYRTESAEAVAL
jgi:hypothetical protein